MITKFFLFYVKALDWIARGQETPGIVEGELRMAEHEIESALIPIILLGQEMKRKLRKQTYLFGATQILNPDWAPRFPEAMLAKRGT